MDFKTMLLQAVASSMLDDAADSFDDAPLGALYELGEQVGDWLDTAPDDIRDELLFHRVLVFHKQLLAAIKEREFAADAVVDGVFDSVSIEDFL